MGKSYWISTLWSHVDSKINELEKLIQPQIAELTSARAMDLLSKQNDYAKEMYTVWKFASEEAEELEERAKALRKKANKAKERFCEEVGDSGYYGTTPLSWAISQVSVSVHDEVLNNTPEGAEIRRLRALRPKISSTIEHATTDKRVNEAVVALAEKIGMDLDFTL